MPCHIKETPAGVTFVCSRPREQKACTSCGAPARFYCDLPILGRSGSRTCDAPLCAACRTHPRAVVDYCEAHAAGPMQPQRRLVFGENQP